MAKKKPAKEVLIRTSHKGWFKELAKAYKKKQDVQLIDDANTGIDPSTQKLLEMGKEMGLTQREWVAVLSALGVSAAGIAMIILAIIDPEPTSKLGLLIAGGAVALLGGGFSAIKILTKVAPEVEIGKGGFKLRRS